MRKFLLSLSIFFFTFSYSYADQSTFVFVTSPQVVLPNTLSKEITIQSRNSAGVLEAITETYDLSYSSDSSSGVFLGSTGKPATKTMSKGTANKTFYYRDTSAGNFTLTVVATGRDSHKSFSITQNVKIGEVVKEIKKVEVIQPKINVKSNVITGEKKVITPPAATTTIEVFTAPLHPGIISKIFYWPTKVVIFLKHLFVEA